MASLSKDAPSSESDSISHPAHMEHKLTLQATGKFVCGGCHQYGAGERYRCQTCKFDLHKQCALDQGTKFVHPLLKNIELELRYQAPGSKDARLVCDACREDMPGFHYHSSKLCLHPCCVNLLDEKKDGRCANLLDEKKDGRGSKFERICKMAAPVVVSVIVAGITGDSAPILDLLSNSTG